MTVPSVRIGAAEVGTKDAIPPSGFYPYRTSIPLGRRQPQHVAAITALWLPTEMTMTLERDGFLSDTIAGLADEAWKHYCPRHVALVERVNRFAIATATTPRELHRRSADLIAALLLGRVIQDFESAVLLGTYGLRAQSRAMVRSTFETALYCVAACRDQVLSQGAKNKPRKGVAPSTKFVDALVSGHKRHRGQVAAELQRMTDVPGVEAVAIAAVLAELSPIAQHQDIDLRGLAEDLGLSDLYTVVYRSLSQDAHPSAVSIEHHLELNTAGKITGWRTGPDYTQFEETLVLAVCSLLVALPGFVERFGTPEEAQELDAIIDAYRAIQEVTDNPPRR